MKDLYKLHTKPKSNTKAIVQGACYRFTILTSRLIRIEYSADGVFEDRATQTVINRDFPVPSFSVTDNGDSLNIKTEYLEIKYTKGEFNSNSLYAEFSGEHKGLGRPWFYGKAPDCNLFGTARTLDKVDGECELEYGVMDKLGMYALDDSNTLAITDDGWVEPRDKSKTDIYLFAYCKDYLECLKDFYELTGRTPLLPRFALGNWWSRYYPYTDKEYIQLMDKFREKNIPFSTAIIDMDWHKVKIDKKYGSGWTGFSWNRDMFENPEEFIKALHDRNLKTALNLHPAEGVAAHEDTYVEMAKAMGADYENEETVEFDISNPDFVEAYFEHMIYPHEKIGVDFWWMDWQQGTDSKMEGLDPLWMLNHFHYLDNAKDGRRPLGFSRYAGVGSHRYPIGFSGDTHMTWESLDFQPYFTATASNVGYGWWSHDIGGHMLGYRDDELTARWIQFGVFSPIMRLHCSMDCLKGKEPWNYGYSYEKSMTYFLRLRHELIPYLHSMNYEASYNGKPIVQPLYYKNPEAEEAYNYRNEYYFGSELLSAPITKKSDSHTNMGNVDVWLPEGEWFDIFTSVHYTGGRHYRMYRDIYSMPVFAKAGAIIPMSINNGDVNDVSNPQNMRICVYPGADNEFRLYEDDDSNSGDFSITRFVWNWGERPYFDILPQLDGNIYAPEGRTYTIEFKMISDTDITVMAADSSIEYEKSYKDGVIFVTVKDCGKAIRIMFNDGVAILNNDYKKIIYDRISIMQMNNVAAKQIYECVVKSDTVNEVYQYLEVMDIDENIKSAVREILSVS